MAIVIITLKIMPESPEVDLSKIPKPEKLKPIFVDENFQE